MADDGQYKRPTKIDTSAASRLPIAGAEMLKSSITDGGSFIQEIDMDNVHQNVAPQTATSHKRIMEGTIKFLQSLSDAISYRIIC